ncbi:MAG: right-handed parallel beta-helix repeat-containing protein, partial [Thermoanaerobaculia bacterium]
GLRIEGSQADIRGCSFRSNAQSGIWITRQSSRNQIGVPDIQCTFECYPTPGPDEISGNGGTGLWIEGEENIVDSALVGLRLDDGRSSPNVSSGIFIAGAHNVVINSTISNNGSDGVFLGSPARFENNSGACNGGPFVTGTAMIGAPHITSVRADPTVITASGSFQGKPNAQYRIDLNSAAPSCPASWQPSLGSIALTTDATGFATWNAMISHTPVTSIFAIATRPDIEETSRPSDTVAAFVSGEYRVDLAAETFAPARALTGEEIEIDTIAMNNGPAAIDSFRVAIPRTAGTFPISANTTSGNCWLGLEFCEIKMLGPGQSATIRERVRVTAAIGTLRHVRTASNWSGADVLVTDPNPANNTAVATTQVVAPRYRPAGH